MRPWTKEKMDAEITRLEMRVFYLEETAKQAVNTLTKPMRPETHLEGASRR
jgi:hypothetical protein